MSDHIILHQMLKIRMVEEQIASRYSEQKMRCPTHLSIGQEAVPATLSVNLLKSDLAVSTHRSHAHYLAKGGSLPKMIAEIYGKATGCSNGKGGSMHLVDKDAGFMGSSAIVGNSIPIGVGLGLSLKLDGSKNIAVIYLGDGATEQGVYYESLNFAAVKNLPVLFVCENNFYSVYSPLQPRQPSGRSIAKVSDAMGVEAICFDGNDITQLASDLPDIISEIRSGGGPKLVECETYRLREHCGPNFDDHLDYRPKKELQNWLSRDPIENYISSNNVSQRFIADTKEKIANEINDAFIFAENSPFPAKENAFLGEYAE